MARGRRRPCRQHPAPPLPRPTNTHRHSQVRWEAFLSLWQNTYAYATILLPSLLLCRRYFAGEIRFGDISQASFAFHTCVALALRVWE